MHTKKKLIRVAAIGGSLRCLLKGQLKYFNQFYHVTAISSPDEMLNDVAIHEGVSVKGIKIERKISPLKDIISLYSLYRFFRSERPQIVHSHTPKAGLLTMVAAKLARVPIRVHTFTGLIFPNRSGPMHLLLKNMDRITCICATKVIPEGQGVKNDLQTHRITRKDLQVVANGNINGIDLKEFSTTNIDETQVTALKNKYKISKNDFVFVFVGRIVKDKGVSELVSAFSQLPESNFKLILVGEREADLDPLDADTIARINSSNNILETGWQDDVRLFLAAADCLVLPSYREGFPNSVIQAGAMGLPCIVTDINGSNEIISDGINGLVVPAKNSQKLFIAMKLITQDRELYSNLSNQARRLIAQKFDQSLVWNELHTIYKRLENY